MAIALGLCEWGWGEYRPALLSTGPRRALSAAEVERWFAQTFGSPAVALDTGSTAIEVALQVLKAARPGRTEVLVPALVCPAVLASCRSAGLQPVQVDVGDDLNTPAAKVRDALGPRTLAVVMVHAYGHPADADGIVAACAAQGVPVIDDAAQRIDPRLRLGTSGDFGIFSFAQSKSVVCGTGRAGGILLVHRREWLDKARSVTADLRPAPPRWLDWLEFALSMPAPRIADLVARVRRRLGAPVAAPRGSLGWQEAAIAQVQLASLEARFERRRALLATYARALGPAAIDAPQLAGCKGYLARLMVRVRATERDACRQALSREGIATRLPYRLADGLTQAMAPRAVRLSHELLELPLPRRLSDEDACRIAAVVSAFAAAPASLPT